MNIVLNHTEIVLLPEKAIFIKNSADLIIADIHLGKTTHFRKHGLPLPGKSAVRDFEKLEYLIHKTKPSRIVFLGDLFHSQYNSEWDLFCSMMDKYPGIEFVLVKGNHDVLEGRHYENSCLIIIEEYLLIDNFILSHHPLEEVPGNKINFCGHIHPGYCLTGKGRQSLSLPCFYYYKNCMILPAFGSLTGLAIMEERARAEVFVVVNDKVMKV